MTKQELLSEMCLLYWEYDTKPDFSDNVIKSMPENSPEKLLLTVYDSLKKEVLASYPWRCAIKYVDIVPTEPLENKDTRYKYSAPVPEDFLKEDGFWCDSERRMIAKNAVEIVGREARTNLDKFTMSYISADIDENNMDPWLISYLKVYVAYKAADIGGLSADRINYLATIVNNEFWTQSNIDYKMATNRGEELNDTLNQFVIS